MSKPLKQKISHEHRFGNLKKTLMNKTSMKEKELAKI